MKSLSAKSAKLSKLAVTSLMALLLLLCACHDDRNFTTDSKARLAFSADTLSFDTVFTSVGSATACFLVYNDNDAGIRLSAFVAGGSHSPFRINVDGQSGLSVPELEMAAHDSIYCFVSVKIDPHDSDNPLLEEDSVRFITEGGAIQCVHLQAYGQDVIRMVGRTVTASDRFTSARPYLIFDTLAVPENVVMNIEKGARLYFHDNAVLKVSGRVVAEGTPDSMILMRGDRLDNMLSDIPYDLSAGRWGGIILDSCSFDNVFAGCDIHGGIWGIRIDTCTVKHEKMFVNGSIIHNVRENAMQLSNCRARIYNSQITNAGKHCVDILGGNLDFLYCTIANFYPWALRSSAVYITNFKDNIIYPLVSASFSNCIITGYGSDEFEGLVADSIEGSRLDKTVNYKVRNSLVLTADTTDTNFSNVVWDGEWNAVYGKDNFRSVGNNDFRFDFALDSLSPARNIAVPSKSCRYDIRGVERPAEGYADAGCYQYTDSL